MGDTSIITQVSREECQHLNSNGKHTPVLNDTATDIHTPKKHHHNRGVLSTIFCCFGNVKRTDKPLHSSGESTIIQTNPTDNTAAVLPHPNHTQTSLTKQCVEDDKEEEEVDSTVSKTFVNFSDLFGIVIMSATSIEKGLIYIHKEVEDKLIKFPKTHTKIKLFDDCIYNLGSNVQKKSFVTIFLNDYEVADKSLKTKLDETSSKSDDATSTFESFYLLPALCNQDLNKKCVVIDLDETLVHSSFKPVDNADFIVPVEIDGTVHQVYVLKRPFVDDFLKRMGEIFECVLFTASLAKYADPVADLLDKTQCFRSRLFRESCVFYKGNYVKDLSKLGRDLHNVVIIDNSPASYIFHPENAIPVTSWFDDKSDTELMDLIPFLESISSADSCITALQNNYVRYKAGHKQSYLDDVHND